MIFKKTDEYEFVRGHGGRALLRNKTKDRYEIWLGCKSGTGDIMWVFYKTPRWFVFDHVASEAEEKASRGWGNEGS